MQIWKRIISVDDSDRNTARKSFLNGGFGWNVSSYFVFHDSRNLNQLSYCVVPIKFVFICVIHSINTRCAYLTHIRTTAKIPVRTWSKVFDRKPSGRQIRYCFPLYYTVYYLHFDKAQITKKKKRFLAFRTDNFSWENFAEVNLSTLRSEQSLSNARLVEFNRKCF